MAKIRESIISKAVRAAKNFLKGIKKQPKKAPETFAKQFKKNYKKKKKRDDFEPGALITFRYDAKHKQLKYDRNPLVVSLGYSKKYGKNYFLGINLHWFPPQRRVTIASFILYLLEDRKGKLVYEDVKPLIKLFKNTPMLRMYIIKRVSKNILRMPPETYKRAASIDYASWHYPSREESKG